MQKLLNSKYFLLLAFPAITGSLITATPSIAGTLAFSESGFRLDNFNINPLDIKAFTKTNTQTVSLSDQGKVNADANANADFDTFANVAESFANNISLSTATGEGKDYFGIAKSFANVTGYNFKVADDGIFSFDFMGFLNLQASVDNPATEYALSDGLISLQLYDQDNGVLLDSLSIQGNTNTDTDNDSNFLIQNKTDNFSFIPTETSFNTEFNSIKKYAVAGIKGNYSRKFAAGANISLFELKTNHARVVVPEPTSNLALVFGAASILIITKTKLLSIKNLRS